MKSGHKKEEEKTSSGWLGYEGAGGPHFPTSIGSLREGKTRFVANCLFTVITVYEYKKEESET